jgi:uncharacterized membrane protein
MEKNLIENEDNISSDEIEKNIEKKHASYKFELPNVFKKTFIVVTLLFIFGVLLLILGIVYLVLTKTGISYLILAIILLIPGVYYTIQFCRARYSKSSMKSEDILRNIPQL